MHQTQIADIQAASDQSLRLAARIIKETGGHKALMAYLRASLCTLLAVSLTEQGSTQARQLMAEGLLTAEQYTDDRQPSRLM